MEYVRLYTQYDQDPAVLAAGEAAEILFLRGIAYAGRAETGGFIPDAQLPRLCPKGSRSRAARLVSEGLWMRLEGEKGYRIRSWSKLQENHDALAQRRRSDRERKARERARRHQESADVSRDMSRDVTPLEERRGKEVVVTSVGRVTSRNGREHEPPTRRTCEDHPHGTDQPCRRCATARHAAADRDRAAAATKAGQLDADAERRRSAAAAKEAAIGSCSLCDQRGYLPNGQTICDHDPKHFERVQAGMASVRAAVKRTQHPTRSETP